MSRGDNNASNRPQSRVTRIFEDIKEGAATAKRQRWTIISAAAIEAGTPCDDVGCDCTPIAGQYKPPASRR